MSFFYQLCPKTIEQLLKDVDFRDNPPPNTLVDIIVTAELVTDICLRIRELENPSA
jgi:hypothetical protein